MPPVLEQNCVYLQSGDPETENTSRLYAPGLLGAKFTTQNPLRSSPATPARIKRYQLVRLTTPVTLAAAQGLICYWVSQAAYTVTTDVTAANRSQVAGVLRTAVTAGNYCCVQIGGYCPNVKLKAASAVTTNSGQSVTASDVSGQALTEAVGVQATYPRIGGVAGALNATPNEVPVELDLPGAA
jgi:hypothetical protein